MHGQTTAHHVDNEGLDMQPYNKFVEDNSSSTRKGLMARAIIIDELHKFIRNLSDG
jgi:hypothetical protein